MAEMKTERKSVFEYLIGDDMALAIVSVEFDFATLFCPFKKSH